ncbi:glucose-1-phosphate adenylyltransferase [Paenibacillus allorhizosphaerae]|uniref:Glucose-1-phosphate adenylyltransferase n=1 Tax=Paenibacillus allorhizosphaerae TaxID=2849866 RepID=A0ABN7TRY1_9BACL|nr:glucose-1-phosphate adenylyltransferase [Paenibacillus allorhizosphaerae]CAG7648693.1 Glucose-1-phosphate adenylyltransferase [Paenibacillus allorhizosphaerae]
MRKKECVAMLLAGGEGRRLGLLTNKLAKPAVHFGGKYRIIDFTLSNCTNSGIDTVGVLTQYQPLVLNTYIGIGAPWDLDRKHGGVTVLPPFMEQSGGDWYKGTANAIYRNISFIEQYDPEYVLIISGDHIYKMNYDLMLDFHKKKGADVTIAVIPVKWEEASRFGIMSVDEEERITEFEEKPKEPKSNLASMGIYIFDWKALKQCLIEDEANLESSKDFGKDLIPGMLRDQRNMYAYPFAGYWKDVGTIQSLWEANMDLLEEKPEFNLNDSEWRIYSVNPCQPGQYIASTAQIRRSLVNEGCCVFGEVDHSVLFYGVTVGEGSLIKDSVIMPNVTIGSNVIIHKAIIGEGTVVEDGSVIGDPDSGAGQDIILIGSNERIGKDTMASAKG